MNFCSHQKSKNFYTNQILEFKEVNMNQIQYYIQNRNVYQDEHRMFIKMSIFSQFTAPNRQPLNVKSAFKLRDHVFTS